MLKAFRVGSRISTRRIHLITPKLNLPSQAGRKRARHAAPSTDPTLNELQSASQTSEEDTGEVLDEFIGPGLQLMQQEFKLSGRDIKLIVPRSSDAVMDHYINAEQWDRDPYWCRAWPSALALGEFISQKPQLVRDKQVCEIGAGLGIAGMTAAFEGASKVVLTDREPLALECAERSCIASGLSATHNPAVEAGGKQISTAELDWTDPDPGIGKFDVLLACDVLYEAQAITPVAALISKLISQTGGRFILADPESRTEVYRREFVSLMLEDRRHPMSLDFSNVVSITMDNISTKIRLMVFRSNPSGDTIGLKPD